MTDFAELAGLLAVATPRPWNLTEDDLSECFIVTEAGTIVPVWNADEMDLIVYLVNNAPAILTLAADKTRLEAEVSRLTRDNERLWLEHNVAITKVRGWEATLVTKGLPLRALRVGEWGPGEGETVSIPEVTPVRLTALLDELSQVKAENAAWREALEEIIDRLMSIIDGKRNIIDVVAFIEEALANAEVKP